MLLIVGFGLLIGLALGLTGGGGSIFAVPLLIYGLGVEPLSAITLSLATVSVVALFGAADAIHRGVVELRVGTIFAVGGVVTAPLGVRLAGGFSDTTILYSFSVLMVIVALVMWRNARKNPEIASVVRADYESSEVDGGPVCRLSSDQRVTLSAPCSVVLVVVGAVTGVLAGFFGVGGGFIIVPALTLVTQLSIHRAVATSLYVIALVGASGFGSALLAGRELPGQLMLLFTFGGLIGLWLGRKSAGRIAGPRLQQFFALMMIMVVAFIWAAE